MLQRQVGNDACKYFGLTCAWRTLHKGDSLPTRVYDSVLLTFVVDRHAVAFEFKSLLGPVENTLWYCLP